MTINKFLYNLVGIIKDFLMKMKTIHIYILFFSFFLFFKPAFAFSLFGNTEYYECQDEKDVKIFKLEIPSVLSTKPTQLYYEKAGVWVELFADISKDKIVMPGWSSGSCEFNYVIFRLEDKTNNVNAKGVYVDDCDEYRKKGELSFITKCTVHLK